MTEHRYPVTAFVALALISSVAQANTITQNVSWTIKRSGATNTYRVVAYGDSIFAGYEGSILTVALRAAPHVSGEYAQKTWAANVDVERRCKSGAVASDIYNNKILAEKSYMQDTRTRVVMFEMCGNDFLQARSSFAGQSGTCDYSVIANALATCTNYQQLAMQAINQYATTAKVKMIANLYYPGYAADNVNTSCKDATTGQVVNKQNIFLPYLARSNWRACNFAAQNGFVCVDNFAQFMGADYDSNGDGVVDSTALGWKAGETEDAYVTRITQTLRSTIRDANGHLASASTSYDYIQSDNTHPTYSGSTIYSGLFGSGSGSSSPNYTDAQIVNGKNPVWNQYGHERMGWAESVYNPPTP